MLDVQQLEQMFADDMRVRRGVFLGARRWEEYWLSIQQLVDTLEVVAGRLDSSMVVVEPETLSEMVGVAWRQILLARPLPRRDDSRWVDESYHPRGPIQWTKEMSETAESIRSRMAVTGMALEAAGFVLGNPWPR